MDRGYLGEFPVQVETTVIKADPASRERVKHWRVWRFDSSAPWYRRWLSWAHYYLWCWGYTLRYLHTPKVIQEIF